MRSALAAFMALMVAAQVVTAQVVSAPAGRAERPTAEALEDALTPPPKNVTRGIRFGDNAPVKPVSANLDVPFNSGSAAITPTAGTVLDILARALSGQKLSGFKFRVEGHTDTVGSPESNRTLSERRAESVVEYLVTKHGIDRARLTGVGLGQKGLLVPTGPGVPEPRWPSTRAPLPSA